MRAGFLRDRVIIEQPVRATDATGASSTTWEFVAEVAAQILAGRGVEGMRSGTEIAEGLVSIRMRELPGLAFDPAWRLTDKDSGTLYDVIAIQPSRKRNDLTVTCRYGGSKRS
jgi:head-tail adaptor